MSTAEKPGILFDCQFDFQPAGQGLFYTGRIGNFNFVYDCGTNSKHKPLRAAIELYASKLNKPLDLLIISHFHADHINEITRLLEATNGVIEVVLPYLFPAQRLLLAAEYAIEQNLSTLENDYVNFLNDPIAYIRKSSPDAHITFLLPETSEGDPSSERQEGKRNVRKWLNVRSISPTQRAIYPELASREKVNVYCSPSIFHVDCWTIKFFCGEPQNKRPRSKIEKLLHEQIPSVSFEHIEEVIHKNLNDLKKIYAKIIGRSSEHNWSSIVCCHGPMLIKKDKPAFCKSSTKAIAILSKGGTSEHNSELKWDFRFDYNLKISDIAPLQMLMGDAELFGLKKHGKKSLEDDARWQCFKRAFSSELSSVGLTLLPHHGSPLNWNNSFLSTMNRCSLWVASVGSEKSKNCSPVKHAITNEKRDFRLCTQENPLTILSQATISPKGWENLTLENL